MYLPNTGDIIQALDAKTGDLIWDYQRALRGEIGGTNRNIAIYGTTIIDTSMDNAVYALDAQTGKLAWETQILDPDETRERQFGSDHRQRQSHFRATVPARRTERRMHHYRARRQNRQGTLANQHDSAARRTGR